MLKLKEECICRAWKKASSQTNKQPGLLGRTNGMPSQAAPQQEEEEGGRSKKKRREGGGEDSSNICGMRLRDDQAN